MTHITDRLEESDVKVECYCVSQKHQFKKCTTILSTISMQLQQILQQWDKMQGHDCINYS